MTHDNGAYVKEDYTIDAGRERVRSYWFCLPRKQDRQDFDPTLPSVFYERERVDGNGWFTDNSSVGFSLFKRTFSFAWSSTS